MPQSELQLRTLPMAYTQLSVLEAFKLMACVYSETDFIMNNEHCLYRCIYKGIN